MHKTDVPVVAFSNTARDGKNMKVNSFHSMLEALRDRDTLGISLLSLVERLTLSLRFAVF